MKIALAETPGWPSPYGRRGALVPLPRRMRFLASDALAAIRPLDAGLIFTDVYRDPTASLLARRRKRGAARPGRSAHNFGLAVDLDVGRTLRALRWDKVTLDARMAEAGWQCYRRDHSVTASESWHFTFGAARSGAVAVEAVIRARYGAQFALKPWEIQRALAALRLYGGAIDDEIGPLTREAIRAFQRTWSLPVTGRTDVNTARLLAVVTAEKEIRT